MSALLHPGVSKVALTWKVLLPRVELSTIVRLSTNTALAQSSQEEQNGPGLRHYCSSALGTESTVLRTPGHVHLSSDQAVTPGGYSVAATGEGSAPEPAHAPPSCVEIEQRPLSAFDLPSGDL